MTAPKRLTDADYAAGAAKLGVDEASIRAIAEVESLRAGFQDDGQPTILFERHVFSRLTKHKFDATHPDISYPKFIPGTYGPASTQHSRLQRAVALDRDAALQSASWGAFQVMGFNYRRAGHKTLQSFINAMYTGGEPAQLEAALNFILSDPEGNLIKYLRARDWGRFARGYNGVGYKANRYDEKLAAAYKKHGGH